MHMTGLPPYNTFLFGTIEENEEFDRRVEAGEFEDVTGKILEVYPGSGKKHSILPGKDTLVPLYSLSRDQNARANEKFPPALKRFWANKSRGKYFSTDRRLPGYLQNEVTK